MTIPDRASLEQNIARSVAFQRDMARFLAEPDDYQQCRDKYIKTGDLEDLARMLDAVTID